jgi:predicted nucleic acid-binding protein
MKYLLDTCVISELVKPVPNPQVTAWIESVPSDTLFLSVITIGELKKGIIKLPESTKKAQLTLWFNTLLEDYDERILPLDLSVSETWGIMQGQAEQAGTPMSTLDGLIAATASTYHLLLVTRNEDDFRPSHLPLLNPWKVKEEEQQDQPEEGCSPIPDAEK